MRAHYRPGQIVRLIGIPANLPADSDGLPTTTLFQLCVGRTFAIVGNDEDLISLDVGEVLGEPAWKHTIYVEPQWLEEI